ncbi:MAG: type I restriction/modification system, specificity subunit [Candidatus Campylobacter infans]|nr:MAG: type I restriction/modification system, specificity subunit [Candidatus Campylobacter infans]
MSNQNIEFKDSQIHWIGHIPKHWEIKKVKDGFYLKKDKALIENPVVLTLARSGIKVRDLENNEGQFAKSYLEYNPVEIDDLLLNTMDLQSGDNCNISRIQGVISPAYANLRYKNGFSPNFYNYYFKIQYWTFAFFTHGKGVSYENRWTLNNQTLMRFPLLVPPLNEQKEIAEFLDKKCTSIDSSIENLEQKTKSLAEYKKALIKQCVTKGLNPKILEFKDSGIPWIRQIPKHWEIIRLGYICNKLNRKIDENDEPLICSNKGQVAFRDKNACGKMLSENHTMQGIQVGDIAIHGMDTWHGAIAYSNLKGKITGVVHVCDSKENNKFIVYFLQYLAIQGVYKLISNGVRGNTSDFRSWNSVKNIYIIVPPLNEQKEIAEFLDKKCEKIDNLSANYKEQIKTLKEYKKALIYECVTGKKQI